MKGWGIALLAITVAAIVYGAVLVRRACSTRRQPSALETIVARSIRSMAIPRAAKEMENPWSGIAPSVVLADARAHWADHCAICHANDGSGDTEIGRNLYPKAPDMRLPATQNLTDGELYYVIRNGVPLTGMPAWGDPQLEQDDESWQLVLFIRHLPQLTEEEKQQMERLNPKSLGDHAGPAPGSGDDAPGTGHEHHH